MAALPSSPLSVQNTPKPPLNIPNQDPNHQRIQTLLTSLQNCTSIKQAKEIHASILRNGLQHQQDLCAKLLAFCAEPPSSQLASNSLIYATRIFEQLQDTATIFMYNTMIRSHAHRRDTAQAISLYNRMRHNGILPNNYTFTFLVKAATDLSTTTGLGRAIHAQSVIFGMPNSDVYIQTALLNMYTSGGNIAIARNVFDRMRHRTAATWNAMIAGYSKRGDVENARRLFDAMPDKDEQSWNIMVCGYAKIGEGDIAERLFEGMPTKTRPTWNAMIAGYAQDSKPVEALGVFRRMQVAGVRPDEITMVTVLPACSQLGALELGEWVHVYIDKNGFDSNVAVCNALIDMYAKCGSIDKAITVFNEMTERSVVSWNTIISGLAIHGRGKEAIELFAEMEKKGVVPDDLTFVGLLNACGHAGFIDRANVYFRKMREVYGIPPKMEHYGCLVDVLGRARHLNEAQELINCMPFEPNSVILGSLLSACRMCNDYMLGERVLKKLVELEPLNPGYYVLLSNMYASSGRWKDVIGIRNLMKSRGIEKIPGCSSIEVDNMVHEFVVGGKTHPHTQEIYAKLDEISEKLRSAGYIPDTSIVLFDLDEEEKAQNLSLHSEKLAVAFGLLKASPAKPIRVVKNLRVCRDCHAAIKLISEIYDREIIVRDRNRFHHFKDGACSCNDYW
ncbi:hypothetical protein MRB53_024780 [Persea americana]|uniref:Uncharacterized protein n=1 Tax=Persea americana TaxID=3435 RepID=A0ACC2LEB0_PERAE|nr:hypothetical protein MRB53_024780 [Persea americana]